MHTCTNTYSHTHTYIQIMHTYIHTYIHAHTQTHTYMHKHIHTDHAYIHTYIHNIHAHTHTYIHAKTHTQKIQTDHTYIHTYIHTYTVAEELEHVIQREELWKMSAKSKITVCMRAYMGYECMVCMLVCMNEKYVVWAQQI
jgi:hypothetical protein